jgi:hypothetical protein
MVVALRCGRCESRPEPIAALDARDPDFPIVVLAESRCKGRPIVCSVESFFAP